MENSRDVSVGDLIYGSDAYYGQVTRIGGSVVEFTTVGLMPAGPKGEQGIQGPIGLTGPQGIQGIPGEVQIKDLPGANLAIPDLSTATDLGGGNYRLYNDFGITLDYNVYNGVWTFNGTSNFSGYVYLPIVLTDEVDNATLITLYQSGYVTFDSAQWVVKTLGNIITYHIFGIEDKTTSRLINDKISSIGFFVGLNTEFQNYQINLQLEKGSTATPYTVPGQIPQYATKEQVAWISPTLLNGWSMFGGTLTDKGYYKDSIGNVNLELSIKRAAPGNSTIFFLPLQYRPSKTIEWIASVGDGISRIVVNTNGGIDIISYPTGNVRVTILMSFRVEV